MGLFNKEKLEAIDARREDNAPRQTVMIVDDEAANRSVMASILAPHYNLIEARDGEEALQLVEALNPELPLACIVSDQRMPKLTGIELFQRIQRMLPSTVRIIVTGYVDVDSIVESINKAEIYKFIVKPFDANDFLLTVRRGVESYQLRNKLEAYYEDLANQVHMRTRELEESRAQLLEANKVLTTDITERKRMEEALTQKGEEQNRLITRLQEAQNQLLQSEKMASIGQLAAGIAHEINNPVGFVNSNMGSLRSYVERLFAVLDAYDAAVAPGDAQLKASLAAIRKTADLEFLKQDVSELVTESMDGLRRVKDIVQALKDFSHVGETDWQVADLHHGLDSTLNIVSNEIKYKATVVKQYGQLPPVTCLASQLNQVFLNLLVNAGHAIAEHGQITVSTGRDGDWVWVSIADTGAGIAPEHRNRIFEPFFTTKPVGSGTGLGLSLSYGIVNNHGGRIEVESEVGRGTTFTVHLPVLPAGASAG